MTPKTNEDWENEFDGRMTSLSRYGGFYHGNKNGVELFDFDNIKVFINNLLSQKDKEREEAYRRGFGDGVSQTNENAKALTPITNEDNLK